MRFRYLSILLIFIIAMFLRFKNYEGRTTFGWDQARDVKVLEQSLSSLKLPLLGPIVRGDVGGFYLGPLYHYLITPPYVLSNHNPLSMVWVSLLIDIGVTLCLAIYFSVSVGIIWAVSSLLINSALAPWNVSLMNLWVLAIILLFSRLIKKPNLRLSLILLFILSTATNIHLTLLPIAGILLVGLLPSLIRSARSAFSYLWYCLALLLPQLTLILSDYHSGGDNIRAFKDFLYIKSRETPVPLLEFLKVLFVKTVNTTSNLFIGSPHLLVGTIIIVVITLVGIKNFKTKREIPLSLLIISIVFLSLIFYRDPNFAEYYLNAMLIPLIILAYSTFSILPKPITYGIIAILVIFNLRTLDFRSGPFSMGVERELINSALPYMESGVELRKNLLPENKQFGFEYYLRKFNISNQESNSRKVYVAESTVEHIPAPPEAPSIIFQNTLAGFRLVVFSN